MIQAVLQAKATNLVDSKRFETKFNRTVDGIGSRVATSFLPQVKQAFSDPGPVVYPIDWVRSPQPPDRPPNMPDGTYSKQKAAFFATDGFGRGIPTERTGAATDGWELVWKFGADGKGEMTLRNRTKHAKFVFGGLRRGNKLQQPFHKKTGWVNAVEQKDRLFVSLRIELKREYLESLGAFGLFET